MREIKSNVVSFLAGHFRRHGSPEFNFYVDADFLTDWGVYVGISREAFTSETEVIAYCEEESDGCTLCNPSSASGISDDFTTVLDSFDWDLGLDEMYIFHITGDDFEDLLTNAKFFCNWFFPISGVQDEQD